MSTKEELLERKLSSVPVNKCKKTKFLENKGGDVGIA
jgi:hypothetical protein